jgi:hypothetical protein
VESLLSNIFNFAQKTFLNLNFVHGFIEDSITETPKNVKKSNKTSQKFLKIDFLDDILANNPGTIKPDKTEKIQKNDF